MFGTTPFAADTALVESSGTSCAGCHCAHPSSQPGVLGAMRPLEIEARSSSSRTVRCWPFGSAHRHMSLLIGRRAMIARVSARVLRRLITLAARERGCRDVLRARTSERILAGGKRCAGGGHVIDQQDASARDDCVYLT